MRSDAMSAAIPLTSATGSSIRFTRRVRAPRAAHAAGEAAALVRSQPQPLRRPWEPASGRVLKPWVRISPEAFADILQVSADPVVIHERCGWLFRHHRYTTQCQGYHFTTRAAEGELPMPPGATMIFAERLRFR